MARRRDRLRRAPIVEAVIDIRVVAQESETNFAAVFPLLSSDYPEHQRMRSVRATFSPAAEQIEQQQADIGLVLRSQNRQRHVQFRVDGFTFNQLEPYPDWPTVFNEALRLWRLYVESRPGIRVTRLAVRYINRIMIDEGANLAEYLEVPPVLPPEVPQHLREYLSRVVVQDVERQLSAVIVQALEPGPEQRTGAILLDVDAFRELRRPLTPSDPEIERIFGDLRDLKNGIFYACITEFVAERYE